MAQTVGVKDIEVEVGLVLLPNTLPRKQREGGREIDR